ncbi:Ribonuclease H domain [Sesbania bispinosa]|nr:Ribonuclease H domain [Sesbania bispinosa]
MEFVLRKINLENDDFLRFLGPQGNQMMVCFQIALWVPPPLHSIKLNVDGSFNPVSRRMGVGGLFRNDHSCWVAGFTSFIGLGDSVEAEFLTVRFGLQFAWDKGFRFVVLESDAKEIIHTLQQHDVELSHRHSGVIVFIHELLERDWSVELKHIPREANFPADWLAKDGARNDSFVHLLEEPPPEVETLMLRDNLSVR